MRLLLLVLGCGLFTLTGCREPAQSTAVSTPSASSAPIAAGVSEPVAPPLEERSSDDYQVRIERTAIAPTQLGLRRATELHLAQLRDQFIGQAMAAREEGFPFDQPWTLALKLRSLIDSDALVVLELEGSEYTGGAHGLPLLASFVYLPPPADQVMAIEDWFVDDEIWSRISEAAIAELVAQFSERDGKAPDTDALEWISGGAGPDPANFALYRPVLDGDGLIRAFAISFQPYQVASYAEGMPVIELPASLFYDALQERHRDRFTR